MPHNPSIRLFGIALLGYIIARTNMFGQWTPFVMYKLDAGKLKTWNSCFDEKIKQFPLCFSGNLKKLDPLFGSFTFGLNSIFSLTPVLLSTVILCFTSDWAFPIWIPKLHQLLKFFSQFILNVLSETHVEIICEIWNTNTGEQRIHNGSTIKYNSIVINWSLANIIHWLNDIHFFLKVIKYRKARSLQERT